MAFCCSLQTTLEGEPDQFRRQILHQYTAAVQHQSKDTEFVLPSVSSTRNHPISTVQIPVVESVIEEAETRPVTTAQVSIPSETVLEAERETVSDHHLIVLQNIKPVPETEGIPINTPVNGREHDERVKQMNLSTMTQVIDVKPLDAVPSQRRTDTVLSTDTAYQTAVEQIDMHQASTSSNAVLSFNTALQSLSHQTDGTTKESSSKNK